jgi:hypothetical protein
VAIVKADVVNRNLESLLGKLGIRRTPATLTVSDIGVLIGKCDRVSGEVAHAGVSAGWFIRSGTAFGLTPAGEAEIQRHHSANSESSTRSYSAQRRLTPHISVDARLQQGDRSLRVLMNTHSATEEEVLRTFARGAQASSYFDHLWLAQNATYQRLKSEGAV